MIRYALCLSVISSGAAFAQSYAAADVKVATPRSGANVGGAAQLHGYAVKSGQAWRPQQDYGVRGESSGNLYSGDRDSGLHITTALARPVWEPAQLASATKPFDAACLTIQLQRYVRTHLRKHHKPSHEVGLSRQSREHSTPSEEQTEPLQKGLPITLPIATHGTAPIQGRAHILVLLRALFFGGEEWFPERWREPADVLTRMISGAAPTLRRLCERVVLYVRRLHHAARVASCPAKRPSDAVMGRGLIRPGAEVAQAGGLDHGREGRGPRGPCRCRS